MQKVGLRFNPFFEELATNSQTAGSARGPGKLLPMGRENRGLGGLMV